MTDVSEVPENRTPRCSPDVPRFYTTLAGFGINSKRNKPTDLEFVRACDYAAALTEIERLRAALQEISESGAEHPWGGPAAFARKTLT